MQNYLNSLAAFYDITILFLTNTMASLLIVSFLKYSNKYTITTEIWLR